MNVAAMNGVGFGAVQAPMAKKMVNRSLLKAPKSNLKSLCGPKEYERAHKWLNVYAGANTGIAAATAQIPGAGIVYLASIEAAMALHIFKGIYGFNLSKSAMEAITAAAKGTAGGLITFYIASQAISWIPFIGNAVNALSAEAVTAALGASLIEKAEELDKQRRMGKDLEEFIKKMKK